ncbi:hypothetical protein BEH_07525 [Priestia filamentosa]|uniref:Uncharacterized protein n=1 Tax=Priestia filamentosa TaxID=1402861 RepID=A0A0H4KGM7_9BACI|nr:hypothetical protein BEH_07525 [Priestia filamentosa]
MEREKLSEEISIAYTDHLSVIIEIEEKGIKKEFELTNSQMSLLVAAFIKRRQSTEWTENLEKEVIEEIVSYLDKQMTFAEILERTAYKFNVPKIIIKKRWVGEGEYPCLKDKYDIAVEEYRRKNERKWTEEDLDYMQHSIEEYLEYGGTSIAKKLKDLADEFGVKLGEIEKIWHGFQGAPSIRDRMSFNPYRAERQNKAGDRRGERVNPIDNFFKKYHSYEGT